MDDIIFSDQPAVSSADALLIDVPSGVESKDDLLKVYQDVLQEAGVTFGMNWDALYDVLTDISYLTDIANQIIIVHNDVPLVGDQGELENYVGVLSDAIDYHKRKMKRRAPLEVYFPEDTRAQILR